MATGLRVPLRSAVLATAERTGLLQRSLAPRVAQTGTTYSDERAARTRRRPGFAGILAAAAPGLEKGARLPAVPAPAGPDALRTGAAAGRWPVVASDRYTLVVFGARDDLDAVKAVATRYGLACVAGDARIQLPSRHRRRQCVVVTRPDTHIHRVVPIAPDGLWLRTLTDALDDLFVKADPTADAAA